MASATGQDQSGEKQAPDPWKDARFTDELGYVICMQDGFPIPPRMRAFKQKYPQYDLYPVLKRIIDERLTSENSDFEGRGAILGLAGLDDPKDIPLLRTLMSIPPRGEDEEVPLDDWSRFAVQAALDMEAKELYPIIHEHLRGSRSTWELNYLICILTTYPRLEFEDDLILLEKSQYGPLLSILPEAFAAYRKAKTMAPPPRGSGSSTTVPTPPTPPAPLPTPANSASGSDSSQPLPNEGWAPASMILIAVVAGVGAALSVLIAHRRRPPTS